MVKLFIRSVSLTGAEGVAREMWRARGVNNDILALWRLRPMFTQAALRASVFVLKRFFLSNSVFWLGRVFAFFHWRFAEAWLYTHCRQQFSTKRNHFFGVQGAQSRLGEHGLLNSSKLRYQLGHFYSNEN